MISSMAYKKSQVLSLLILVLLLSGCSTLQQILVDVVTPELTVVDTPYIVKAELPIIGSGEVVMRVPMEAYNPNAVGLELTAVDLDLFLQERKFAEGLFEKQFTINANNRSRFDLDVSVPITTVLWEWQTLTGLAAGSPTRVTVDAAVTVKVLDLIKVSAKTRLFDEVVGN